MLVGGFVDGRLAERFVLSRDGDGWRVEQSGDCVPRLSQGRVYAAEWLVHETSRQEGTAQILVQGGECEGQPDAATRLVDVVVDESADTVMVTAWAHPGREPAGGCVGEGTSIPATVELSRPLDGRSLVDGGVVPPTSVASAS